MKKIHAYDAVQHIVLVLVSLMCVIPFALLIVASFSSEASIARNGYTFFPSEWSLEAYSYMLREKAQILRSYGITIVVTIIGTTGNIIISTLLAYPLSRPDLSGRKVWNFLLFFTLLFNGGLVPSYLLWTRYLHLGNTIWALIFPNLFMNAFYVIMIRSYYQSSIPYELIEAARMDGAGEWKIYSSMILPLSKPILATVGLFVGLSYWNDWNNGLIYVTNNDSLNSIQLLLYKMMENIKFMSNNSSMAGVMAGQLPTSSVRMAIAVVGVLPVLLVYPFVQKFLVKGIVVGAVKG